MAAVSNFSVLHNLEGTWKKVLLLRDSKPLTLAETQASAFL